MIIHNNINSFKANNPIVTVGTFDGVHLGHRRIIDAMKELAENVQGETVLFTFYPHPRLIVSPEETSLRLLTSLEEKKELLDKAGIDHLVIYPFSKEFSKLSYLEFVEQILIGRLNAHSIVVGHDHRLGNNREGSFEKLSELAQQLKFKIYKMDALTVDHINVSSTKIREALQMGHIQKANQYLGSRFMLHGKVSLGNQIGRDIGFPTANIVAKDSNKLIPAIGVYAVQVKVEEQYYFGMLNIGFRPTINKNADQRTIEVHIFNFKTDIYGKEITLYLDKRIRDELKFDGLDELKKQLENDRKLIRAFYNI